MKQTLQTPVGRCSRSVAKRGSRGLAALFAVLLLSIVAGCEPGPSPAGPSRPPASVITATPLVKQIVEWDSYVGRLQAIDFVEVRSRVSGYLRSIHFDEGELVSEGDLLFVIDPRPFEAELTGAQARLREAEAQREQAEAMLVEAKAQRRQWEAAEQLARVRLERARSLSAENAIAAEEVDTREADYVQAQADVEASAARIASAEAAIANAAAAIASAEASVEAAALELAYTRIEAPITGRISQHRVTEGNLISGGSAQSTLLTTITSIDPIHCVFDASEDQVLRYIRLAQRGQRASSRDVKNPVFLALEDEEGFPHRGHMDFVDNRFDAGTATLRARCIFPNEDGVLVPGMFGRIRIPGSAPYKAILVPDSAISFDQDAPFLYVVNDENVVLQKRVELGPIVDGLRVIRDGLQPADRLITEGLLQARPGTTVQPEAGEIHASDDGLPDSYQPVPAERWLGQAEDDTVTPPSPSTPSAETERRATSSSSVSEQE